jgi:hypothetical protein
MEPERRKAVLRKRVAAITLRGVLYKGFGIVGARLPIALETPLQIE